MKCFVTGANGFIGFELTKELIKRNYEVNILVRQDFHIKDVKQPAIFRGNLWDVATIDQGMKGCDYVFHLAAYANIWSKDKTLPYKTNVEGTRNILECALRNKIKRVVFTSTAGVFAPSADNETVDENTPVPETYLTDYEQTKRQAELLCLEYLEKGLDIVILNPTRVFGPGLLNKSNSVTILIQKYIKGKWRIIPGDGNSVANYVFINDVIQGHVNAVSKGNSGENYILGGTNTSLNEFFKTIQNVSGIKFRMIKIPVGIIRLAAYVSDILALLFGIRPFITVAWLEKLLQPRIISSNKSEKNLDYKITPLKTGISETIKWLNSGRV